MRPPLPEEWLDWGNRIDESTADALPPGTTARGSATVLLPSGDVVGAYCSKRSKDLWNAVIQPSPVQRFEKVLDVVAADGRPDERTLRIAALAYSVTRRAHSRLAPAMGDVWERVDRVYGLLAETHEAAEQPVVDLTLQAVYAVALGWRDERPLDNDTWNRTVDDLSVWAFRALVALWNKIDVLRAPPLSPAHSGPFPQIYGHARGVVVAWLRRTCVKGCSCKGTAHIPRWDPTHSSLWTFVTNQFYNTLPDKISTTPVYPLLRSLEFDVRDVVWPICPHTDSVRERVATGALRLNGSRGAKEPCYPAHDYLPRDTSSSDCEKCRTGGSYTLASRKLLLYEPEWQTFDHPDRLPPDLVEPTAQMMRDHNPNVDWFYSCRGSTGRKCHRIFRSSEKQDPTEGCGVPLVGQDGVVRECDGRTSTKATWKIFWRANALPPSSIDDLGERQLEVGASSFAAVPGNVYLQLALTAYRDSLDRPDVRESEPLERFLMRRYILSLQGTGDASGSLVRCWIEHERDAAQSPSDAFVAELEGERGRLLPVLREDNRYHRRLEAILRHRGSASVDVDTMMEQAKTGDPIALRILARALSPEIRRYHDRLEGVLLFAESWVYPRYPVREKGRVPLEARALFKSIAHAPPWAFHEEIPRLLHEVHDFAVKRGPARVFCPADREFYDPRLGHREGSCPCIMRKGGWS